MKKKIHKKGVIKKKIFLRMTKERKLYRATITHVLKRHGEEEKRRDKMRKRKRENKLVWYNRKGDSCCSDNELSKKFHSNP